MTLYGCGQNNHTGRRDRMATDTIGLDYTSHPKDVRERIREGKLYGFSTSGICGGYLQANLAILPQEFAEEFAEFCRLNRSACPVLYASEPGEVAAPPLAEKSDIRTDVPKYHVVENGNLVSQPSDLLDKEFDTMVTFYLGCSFTFEMFLKEAGIPCRHSDHGRNVPMFITNIVCHPVGRFVTPMVVSLRPIPRDKVEKTVQVTTACECVHGAPVHIGNPEKIGIKNICNQTFGDQVVDIAEDDVPVFWACGVTSSVALKAAGPELAFHHAPGCMFICDMTAHEYIEKNPPTDQDLVARVLFIEEDPAPFATIISEPSLEKIENVLKCMKGSLHIDDMTLPDTAAFPKAVLGLSHLNAVSLVCSNLQLDEGFLALVSLLQAMDDKEVSVSLLNPSPKVMPAVETCVQSGILSKSVQITDVLAGSSTDWDSSSPVVHFECRKGPANSSLRVYNSCRKTGEKKSTEYLQCNISSPAFSDIGGFALAAGLYIARTCPHHDRYIRRGIGFPQTGRKVPLSHEGDEALMGIGMPDDTLSRSRKLMMEITG